MHPLSPIVRAGRAAIGLLVIIAASTASSSGRKGGSGFTIDYAVLALVAVAGLVSWYVTTWHLEGDSLQVATGLIRRQTVRIPLSRVQAIDVVEPWLGRIFGVAEVRVRTGGASGGDARLMYLKLDEATRVRASLLALAHGLPDSTPPPAEIPLLVVSNKRLVLSTLVTGGSLASLGIVLAVAVLAATRTVSPAAIGAGGGTVALYLFGLGRAMARRMANEWGFQVAEAPDGLRIRCGFGSRVAETIPAGRVQAIKMIEPFWWRPLGWYRLELHLAGGVRHGRNQPRAEVRRALLPVGTRADADLLLGRVIAGHVVALERPPLRAAWRAPLTYHFLAAGRNEVCAVAVSGRVRRLTEWAPLAKVQSIRSVRGPIERALRLATVHLDVAGRRVAVRWLERDSEEVTNLMELLPVECEQARDSDSEIDAARRAERLAGVASSLAAPAPSAGPGSSALPGQGQAS